MEVPPDAVPPEPYYRANLAHVHHHGFGDYADRLADDVLALLGPVRERGGLVLELGCGSGSLTRHLIGSGHRVIASDASPAMLDLAREFSPGATEYRLLALPDDPLPSADAIVSVGHMLNYVGHRAAIERAVAAIARALNPGALLALDVCTPRWGEVHRDEPPAARVSDDWAVVTRYALPDPHTYVRQITTFVRNSEGGWVRDDERHVNVLVEDAEVVAWLGAQGVEASAATSFGRTPLPDGLVAVVGRRRHGG